MYRGHAFSAQRIPTDDVMETVADEPRSGRTFFTLPVYTGTGITVLPKQ